jgi:DNA-binding SARP family transcriptional activator/tetratricopeptide (TPR) repeat protein
VANPPPLTQIRLEETSDPAALLALARELEPELRLNERTRVLDRLQTVLDQNPELRSSAEHDWLLELVAERAIDAAADVRLDEGEMLAHRVLDAAAPENAVAIARATLAWGRVLAWRGTEETNRRASKVLEEAAERFAALGNREMQGFCVFWRGQAVNFQTGAIPQAVELIGEALKIMGPDSPRRCTILSFYADTLIELGEWDAATVALDEAAVLADRDGNEKARAYVAWSRAHMASLRGDPYATERLVREVEHDCADWFATHIGVAFMTDAVEYLDRVGLQDEANTYLERAIVRLGDDESIRQARAMMLARSGDPDAALEALQELVRGDWLEKRLTWRNTLMTAWATFRAGRSGAGELAKRAFEQAVANGGIRVALAGEHDLALALAPLAHRAGSTHARELMLDGRSVLVSLFGTPQVVLADGEELQLPAGKPGELVRMLAIHEHGMQVEEVCEAFFPEVAPQAAKQRLRQILTRLRAAGADVVVRDGDVLRLLPAWVDLREFLAGANRVRAARGPREVQKAYAALALWNGPLLPADLYAPWADEVRRQAEYKHLQLLETIVSDAATRGAHQEALTALDAALQADSYDIRHYEAIIEHLMAAGQHATAMYLADRVGIELPVARVQRSR